MVKEVKLSKPSFFDRMGSNTLHNRKATVLLQEELRGLHKQTSMDLDHRTDPLSEASFIFVLSEVFADAEFGGK